MGLRMQPRNEKFFTLFSRADFNVVESLTPSGDDRCDGEAA